MIDSIIMIIYIIALNVISYIHIDKMYEDKEIQQLEKKYKELKKEKRGGRRG